MPIFHFLFQNGQVSKKMQEHSPTDSHEADPQSEPKESEETESVERRSNETCRSTC